MSTNHHTNTITYSTNKSSHKYYHITYLVVVATDTVIIRIATQQYTYEEVPSDQGRKVFASYS